MYLMAQLLSDLSPYSHYTKKRSYPKEKDKKIRSGIKKGMRDIP